MEGCSLVVTTGGTGPAPRDVTPEATEAVRTGKPRPGCSQELAVHLTGCCTRGGNRHDVSIKTLLLCSPPACRCASV